MKSLSHVQLFATPGTVAHQAPRPMGFSRHEDWSGLPFPSPGDLPNPVPRPAALFTYWNQMLSGSLCFCTVHCEIYLHQIILPNF